MPTSRKAGEKGILRNGGSSGFMYLLILPLHLHGGHVDSKDVLCFYLGNTDRLDVFFQKPVLNPDSAVIAVI